MKGSSMKRNNSYVESIDDNFMLSSSSSSTNVRSSNATAAPVMFHRRMYSADGYGNSASRASTSRFQKFDRSSPPNYYQLALAQEEENRERQNLISLIYSSSSSSSAGAPPPPPDTPPPSIPINSSETFSESFYSAPKLRIDNSILNNNLRPPLLKHLRSASTDASFGSISSQNIEEIEESNIEDENGETGVIEDSFNEFSFDLNSFVNTQFDTTTTMKPSLEISREKRKILDLSDIEKSNDFSLSVDENYAPNQFQSIPSTSSSQSNNSSPLRSQSAPPKRNRKNSLLKREHLTIDEEGNSHELSLFYCSPTVSHSSVSMELMNTSEMGNGNDEEDGHLHHSPQSCQSTTSDLMSPKPGNIFTFDETEIDRNPESMGVIQSRPLPPIPNDNDEIPDEPEDMAPDLEIPEPEYACVGGEEEEGYEAIHHQRSISDHVLSYGQKMEENIKATDLKKSNSDRSERKSMRKMATTSLIERSPSPGDHEDDARKLSDIVEHRKTMSYSTPSFIPPAKNDARKRSITNEEEVLVAAPQKQSIPSHISCTQLPSRKSSTEQYSGSVKLRDSSKSMSIIGEPKQNPVNSFHRFPQIFHIMRKGNENQRPWKNFFTRSFISPTDGSKKYDKAEFNNQQKGPAPGSPFPRNSSESSNVVLRKVSERPWRSFFTRSFISPNDGSKKSDEENDYHHQQQAPPQTPRIGHRRRFSIIGDVESDRKIIANKYAPSPADCAKLDLFERQFKYKTRHLSDSIFTSDDEEEDDVDCCNKEDLESEYQSDHHTFRTPRRRRRVPPATRTLSRLRAYEGNAPVTSSPSVPDSRALTIPRKARGGVQKRWKKREQIHRRRSVNQTYIESTVLENTKRNQDRDLDMIKKCAFELSSVNSEVIAKMSKRQITAAVASDINKQYKLEKDKKKSNNFISGILSLSKKPKSKPSLANVYPNYNNPLSPQNSSPISQVYPYKANELTLPDVLSTVFNPKDYGKHSDSGSEGVSTPFSGTHSNFSDDSIPLPNLIKPNWEDLDLWVNEPGSWSLCHPHVQLSSSEKKRQNIIYELYMTEKNHCRVIVFLQQAYLVGLREYSQASRCITEDQIDRLIPDVLDSLLNFHLNLLRRLKQKKEQSVIVDTVSDIVLEEFENGLFTTAAISAYTSFCLSRDESCQVYSEMMEKNLKFKKFFDHYETDPAYKQHNFKSCLLLIAQRLTKYNLLFDSIIKHDPIERKSQTQRALTAVRDFARRVDSELKKNDLQKKWNQLKSLLDKKSRGKILNRDFTYDDLVHQRMDDPRIVLAIGKVNYIASSAAQQSKDKIELTMVLFDDILVLFYLRNNSLHFYNSNMISSVIPLKTLLVREMERTNECMLLCTDKEKPDLYHLSFPSKNELRNWVSSIHSAKATVPPNIRYAPGRKSEVILQKHEEFNEEPHNLKIQEWQDSLQSLFDERKQKEELLRDYMVGRMRFFDEVREHFKKFPIRHLTVSTSAVPASGSLIERRETRDLEKIKNLVQQKFLELRDHRHIGLDTLVETAQKARDNDLESFFDDLHDLTIANSSSSDSSASERIETSTTSNSEDEPLSVASKEKKPRRVRTYHGTSDSQPRGSIRRHTTVPKFGEKGIIGSDDDEIDEQIDASIQKLPLSMSTRARKAATSLIHENVNFRIENNKLKSEVALQELHISSLKSRKTAVIETAEKLESLRQKQEEIQARERKLKQDQELFKDEIRRRIDDLDAREERMKRREAEYDSRMQYTQATFRSGSCVFQENEHHHPPPTPLISTTSPTIRALAVKTQTKSKRKDAK